MTRVYIGCASGARYIVHGRTVTVVHTFGSVVQLDFSTEREARWYAEQHGKVTR